jgi:hypothetical protein
MKALTHPSVEPPTRLFTVSFVALGTILRPAIRRRVPVLAATHRGAKRIARLRYPRSCDLSASLVPRPPAHGCPAGSHSNRSQRL